MTTKTQRRQRRRSWSDQLRAKHACSNAISYAQDFDTFQAAWDTYNRPDWLIWWLCRTLPKTRPTSIRLTCVAIRLVRAIPNRWRRTITARPLSHIHKPSALHQPSV